jgi:hypothetical protein
VVREVRLVDVSKHVARKSKEETAGEPRRELAETIEGSELVAEDIAVEPGSLVLVLRCALFRRPLR